MVKAELSWERWKDMMWKPKACRLRTVGFCWIWKCQTSNWSSNTSRTLNKKWHIYCSTKTVGYHVCFMKTWSKAWWRCSAARPLQLTLSSVSEHLMWLLSANQCHTRRKALNTFLQPWNGAAPVASQTGPRLHNRHALLNPGNPPKIFKGLKANVSRRQAIWSELRTPHLRLQAANAESCACESQLAI